MQLSLLPLMEESGCKPQDRQFNTPQDNSKYQINEYLGVSPQGPLGLLQKGPTLTLPNFARTKRQEGGPNVPVCSKRPEPARQTKDSSNQTLDKSLVCLPVQYNYDSVQEQARTPSIAIVGNNVDAFNARTPAVAIVGNNVDACNARTPLVIPRIGIVKGSHNNDSILKPGENPWLISKNERSAEVKITAITPIGTIAMVPTLDKRPPPTPRRVPPPIATTPAPGQTPTRHLTLRVIDENTGDVKIDPLLSATIYLDCTRPEDQDYNHVANKMRAITENTITLQKQYINQLRPLPKIHGKVSHDIFEEALSVYENNQVYYQDRIDDHGLDAPTIKQKLTELEHWFMHIIEPSVKGRDQDEIEARKEREQSKITRGISAYCDPELYPYITPAGKEIRAFIAQNHG